MDFWAHHLISSRNPLRLMGNKSLAVMFAICYFCSTPSCVTKAYLWVLFLTFDAVRVVLLMAEAIVHHVLTLSDSASTRLEHVT